MAQPNDWISIPDPTINDWTSISDPTPPPASSMWDFFPALWEAPKEMWETFSDSVQSAVDKLYEGNYPGAFHDIAQPLMYPFEQLTQMGANKAATLPSQIGESTRSITSQLGQGNYPDAFMGLMNIGRSPQQPMDRTQAASEGLGYLGFPVKGVQEAWEQGNYPRLAGQTVGALAPLLAGYGAAKYLNRAAAPPPPIEAVPTRLGPELPSVSSAYDVPIGPSPYNVPIGRSPYDVPIGPSPYDVPRAQSPFDVPEAPPGMTPDGQGVFPFMDDPRLNQRPPIPVSEAPIQPELPNVWDDPVQGNLRFGPYQNMRGRFSNTPLPFNQDGQFTLPYDPAQSYQGIPRTTPFEPGRLPPVESMANVPPTAPTPAPPPMSAAPAPIPPPVPPTVPPPVVPPVAAPAPVVPKAPDLSGPGDVVSVARNSPNFNKAVATLLQKGYKFLSGDATQSTFKKLFKSESGAFTPVEMWQYLKEILKRDPTPDEVETAMSRQVREGEQTGRVAPFPTQQRREFQDIANRDNVTMGGVNPQRGVPIVHDPKLGGFQHHVRGNENWVTHPMLDEPVGPFKTGDEAFDWALDFQETPEFRAKQKPTSTLELPTEPDLDRAEVAKAKTPKEAEKLIEFWQKKEDEWFAANEFAAADHAREMSDLAVERYFQTQPSIRPKPRAVGPNDVPRLTEGQQELPFGPRDILKQFINDETGTFDPDELWKNFKSLARTIWENEDIDIADGYFKQYDKQMRYLDRPPHELQREYNDLYHQAELLPPGPEKMDLNRRIDDLLSITDMETGVVNPDLKENIGSLRDESLDRWRHLKQGITEIPEHVRKFMEDETGAMPLESMRDAWRTVKEATGIGQGVTKTGAAKKGEVSYLREAVSLPKGLTTTLDVSYPGRQGLPQLLTPEFWEGFAKMFATTKRDANGRVTGVRPGAVSYEGMKAINEELLKNPIMQSTGMDKNGNPLPSFAEKYMGIELNLPASEPGLNARMEATASKWIETGGSIPYLSKGYRHSLGYPVRMSNRMYITMHNVLKINRAQKLVDTMKNMSVRGLNEGRVPAQGLLGGIQFESGKNWGFTKKVTPEQAMDLNPYTNLVLAKELGDAINTFTGQAPLKTHVIPLKQTEINAEKIGNFLRGTLFSPGLFASRFRLTQPATYMMATPFVRKQYMKALLSTGAGWFIAAELIKNMAGEDVEVGNVPTSADFGKVRIGDTRLDTGGGFLQFLTAYARMWEGGSTSSATGEFHRFGSGYQAETQEDMGERFMVNKLEPVTKFIYDLYSASEYKPFHVGDRLLQLATPLYLQDIISIASEQPDLIPWLAPVGLGMGTQTYGHGESVGKLIAPENDWLVTGGGLKDIMPWNWNAEPGQEKSFPWSDEGY